ncbi:glycosyltransferase [Psychrobacillus glaciei]|uniref:Glycosyltransferase n=1 Tax=Psychrobacillus glaciei TaxID=2283160 RepID=A0A5J6SPH2_9BACI|nr:glycosyltransferase [Psychrobacillus glaciei]QFF99868.1 glycosyltransferase [Psychrobacillus glaciei]
MVSLKYSVLMSVYYKEKPEYLRESISSMLQQSIIPDEIVLIKDGPLTDQLEIMIDEFKDNDIIKVISLDENVGLGKALNIGLSNCRNELIARMDTDDIADKNRCERQLDLFNKDKKISVVGTVIEEFIDYPSNPVSYRKVKIENREIRKQIKYRNPMSHPSVMLKKSDVLKAGNYQHWLLNEDYYLWIRMVQHGFIFKNINEPLVKMRINNETYLRRGGWKYFATQKDLFGYMLKSDLINVFEYLFNIIICFVTRVLLTNKMRKFFYLRILRSKQ